MNRNDIHIDNYGNAFVRKTFDVMADDRFVRQVTAVLRVQFDFDIGQYVFNMTKGNEIQLAVEQQYPSLQGQITAMSSQTTESSPKARCHSCIYLDYDVLDAILTTMAAVDMLLG